MCSGSEAGSYLRLIDIVSLNSRLECNKEEEEEETPRGAVKRRPLSSESGRFAKYKTVKASFWSWLSE